MRTHKLSFKYAQGLDALSGEGEDEDNIEGDDTIPIATSMFSELAKGVGETVARKQAQTAAAEKAKKDEPVRKAQEETVNKAKSARQNANNKATEAEVARLKALTEQDPSGPLHKEAAEAARIAALYDADARGFEMKAGLAPQTSLPSGQSVPAMVREGGIFTARNALIGGGVVLGIGGLAAILYKLFSSRRST
jgi:hypothetical protein